MFELEEFIEWLPERVIAGAYANGKWPSGLRLHQELIHDLGLQPAHVKVERLVERAYQEKLFSLVEFWMQGRGSRMCDKVTFRTILERLAHSGSFGCLDRVSLATIDSDPTHGLERVWDILCPIVNTKSKLVAISKCLHHVFPLSIVPIDRKYSQMFYENCRTGGRKLYNKDFTSSKTLLELTQIFQEVGRLAESRLSSGPTGRYYDTSDTKAIDNWIVMWVDYKLGDAVK